MKEIWRDIKGFEGIYQVSSFGDIKSLDRWKITKDGRKCFISGRIRANGYDIDGYCITVLTNSPIRRTIKVHRVVAEAFIPNPDNKPVINHINGIKDDNRVENLEWCTHSENAQHAYNIGLRIAPHTKKILMLTIDNKPLLWFDNLVDASKSISVNSGMSCISKCARGKRFSAYGYKWKHID